MESERERTQDKYDRETVTGQSTLSHRKGVDIVGGEEDHQTSQTCEKQHKYRPQRHSARDLGGGPDHPVY